MSLSRSQRATLQHAKKRMERNALWITDSNNIVHIPLTQGFEALIDKEDESRASQYTWCLHSSRKNGKITNRYAFARIPGTTQCIFLHHFVKPRHPELETDHADRNGLNCVKTNLRYATSAQNMANIPKRRLSRPYRGVYKPKDSPNRWAAKLFVNGVEIYLGRFETAEAAAIAYNEAARIHHGEFATLNEIPS